MCIYVYIYIYIYISRKQILAQPASRKQILAQANPRASKSSRKQASRNPKEMQLFM